MKKLIFSLLCVFALNTNVKAQYPVTDITHVTGSIIYWAQDLAKEINKLELMVESQGYLLESINFCLKVHQNIKNSLMIYSILEKQYNFYTTASEALTLDNTQIASHRTYKLYTDKVKALIEKSNDNVAITSNFIVEGMFKMNDSERIEAAERIEKKTDEFYTALYDLKRNFEGNNNRMLAIKILKNN